VYVAVGGAFASSWPIVAVVVPPPDSSHRLRCDVGHRRGRRGRPLHDGEADGGNDRGRVMRASWLPVDNEYDDDRTDNDHCDDGRTDNDDDDRDRSVRQQQLH
jgi:hypothetical protein